MSTRKSVIGKFFHSFNVEGLVEWQGKVLCRPQKDVYLCQLCEWVLGTPTDQVLIPFSQMLAEHWVFYDTADLMNDAYERKYSRRVEKAKAVSQ